MIIRINSGADPLVDLLVFVRRWLGWDESGTEASRADQGGRPTIYA